mmetsp:Transcript_7741/g.34365  ORF Transcript_7741/g.34365 Transcript_7741/m.34365 type:complete len:221 (+) Transcript_7741:2612-3274(+)
MSECVEKRNASHGEKQLLLKRSVSIVRILRCARVSAMASEERSIHSRKFPRTCTGPLPPCVKRLMRQLRTFCFHNHRHNNDRSIFSCLCEMNRSDRLCTDHSCRGHRLESILKDHNLVFCHIPVVVASNSVDTDPARHTEAVVELHDSVHHAHSHGGFGSLRPLAVVEEVDFPSNSQLRTATDSWIVPPVCIRVILGVGRNSPATPSAVDSRSVVEKTLH